MTCYCIYCQNQFNQEDLEELEYLEELEQIAIDALLSLKVSDICVDEIADTVCDLYMSQQEQ